MKFLAVVTLVALIGSIQAVTTDEEEEKLALECAKLSGVNVTLLANVEKGIIADDPKLAEFLFCVYKKEGTMNEAGEIDPEVLRAETTKDLNSKLADTIVENCSKKKYSSGIEAAVELTKCYYKYAPKKE